MIQVIDNEIKQYRLPKTGTLSDGTTVSAYHLLPIEVLKSEGWLPLVDEPPNYDLEKEYLIPSYVIHDAKVVKEYEIREIQKSEFDIVIDEVRKLVRVDELTKEELVEKINLYEDWSNYIGKFIPKDEVVKYDGKLYKVIKGLDVLDIYPPSIVPSEYTSLMPDDVIPNWEQRYGHNPYLVGDKVIASDGNVYELVLANWMAYEPPNQGWK